MADFNTGVPLTREDAARQRSGSRGTRQRMCGDPFSKSGIRSPRSSRTGKVGCMAMRPKACSVGNTTTTGRPQSSRRWQPLQVHQSGYLNLQLERAWEPQRRDYQRDILRRPTAKQSRASRPSSPPPDSTQARPKQTAQGHEERHPTNPPTAGTVADEKQRCNSQKRGTTTKGRQTISATFTSPPPEQQV